MIAKENKTIALLTYGPDDPNNQPLWEGVFAEAQSQGCNLICFPGRSLQSKRGFDRQANVLYDLIGEENVDGVIIWGARLTTHVSADKLKDFCLRYHPLPVVNIGMPLTGIPSVFVDNYKSMQTTMEHLIKDHDYTRIAFVSGPTENPEVEERYSAYRDSLEEYNIPFNANYIVNGDWSRGSGAGSISLLLDERKCSFDAIVAANDMMALGAIGALRKRDMSIPSDIAVVGFDNIRESRYSNPPLTTVRQSFVEYGQLAVQLLVKLLDGEELSDKYPIALNMVLRQSCGCPESVVERAKGNPIDRPIQKSGLALITSKENVIADVRDTSDGLNLKTEEVYRLWEAFYDELKRKSTEPFLSVLDEILQNAERLNSDTSVWQNFISSIRRFTLPHIGDAQTLLYAEDLCHQARAMVGERSLRIQEYRRLKIEQQAGILDEISQALGTTSELDELTAILSKYFPYLEIPSCCLSLYVNPAVPTGFCRPILIYQNIEGMVEVKYEGQHFYAEQLVVNIDMLQHKPFSIVVEPIYFQENQIGFIVFELGPKDLKVYDTLRGQLSSALWGSRLVQYLQSLYESSISVLSLQKPQQILQDVVDQACKAVGAQSANIVFVDAHKRPYRLATGGDYSSSLDTSTLIGDTVYALEAMQKNKPVFIEDTRNQVNSITQEMLDAGIEAAACFPMRLRGKSVGVFWVYYEKPHWFSKIEINALRLYVNQAAIVYDNARQVQKLERLRHAAEELANVAEVQEALRQIAKSARDVFDANSSVIWSYDAERTSFLPGELVADGVTPEILEEFRDDEPRPEGTAATVLKHGYLAVPDIDNRKFSHLRPTSPRLRDVLNVKAFQGIILQVEGESLGVLYVNYSQERTFSREDRSTLEAFAYDAANALKKVRLLQQLKKVHHTARKVATVSVLENMASTLKAVAKGAREGLDCDAVTLYTYNKDIDRIGFPPAMDGVLDERGVLALGDVENGSRIRAMLEHNKIFIAKDAMDSFLGGSFVKREGVKSSAGIPLKVGDRKVGVMFVNYRTKHHFSEEEVADIELFAHLAAVAIRNAQLYDNVTKKATYLQRLNEAGNAITGTLALDEILGQIAKQSRMFTGYDGQLARFCHIGLVEDNKLKFKATYPPEYVTKLKEWLPVIDLESEKRIGITGRVALDGNSKLVDNVQLDPDYIEGDPDTISELAVPIKIGEKVIGVINVEHPNQKAFDEDDQNALEALAAQAATAIRNALQYEELTRTKGLVGARTALAWMGMTSSAWRHVTGNQAQSIIEQVNLLLEDLIDIKPKIKYPEVYKRLSLIQKSATQIKEKPITPPLSIEEGTISVPINELVMLRAKQLRERVPYQLVILNFDLALNNDATVRASPEWLRRALDIVIDNAMDAIGNMLEGKINITTKQNDKKAEIRIIDNANGIPEEVILKLFKEPVKKKKGAEGLGMGLLIAQVIVQTYGGDIVVESTGPQGTTMLICLPMET